MITMLLMIGMAMMGVEVPEEEPVEAPAEPVRLPDYSYVKACADMNRMIR